MLYSRRPIFYLSSDISLMTSTNSNDDSSTSTAIPTPICSLTNVPICPGAPKQSKSKIPRGGACTMMPRNLFPAVACPPAPRKSKLKIPIRVSMDSIRRALDFDAIDGLMANFQSEMNHAHMLTGELKVLAVLADL